MLFSERYCITRSAFLTYPDGSAIAGGIITVTPGRCNSRLVTDGIVIWYWAHCAWRCIADRAVACLPFSLPSIINVGLDCSAPFHSYQPLVNCFQSGFAMKWRDFGRGYESWIDSSVRPVIVLLPPYMEKSRRERLMADHLDKDYVF